MSKFIDSINLNDSDLIQGLISKQTSAINYFVNNYQQFIYVLCVKMLNNNEIAEEITQDVLIKSIEKIDQFKGQSKLKTWIYTLAKREVLNYIRINKPETVNIENHPPNEHINNIEEQLNQKDIKQAIQQAFEFLNFEQKEILTLFYLQELSLKEIAEMTTLSESNVRVKLHRARERFKKIVTKKDLSLLKQIHYE